MTEADSWIIKYAKLLKEAMGYCQSEEDWDIFIGHFLLHSTEFALFHSLIYLKLIERDYSLIYQANSRITSLNEKLSQLNSLSETFQKMEEGLMTFLKLHQKLEARALSSVQIKQYLDSILKIADSVLEFYG